MKKLMTAVTCLAMAVTAIVARAEQVTQGGITWTYSVYDGKAILSEPAIPQDTSGDITIPASLGGYPVTEVSGGAFWKCTQLRSVVIP